MPFSKLALRRPCLEKGRGGFPRADCFRTSWKSGISTICASGNWPRNCRTCSGNLKTAIGPRKSRPRTGVPSRRSSTLLLCKYGGAKCTNFRRWGKSTINGQRSTSPLRKASSELVPVSTQSSSIPARLAAPLTISTLRPEKPFRGANLDRRIVLKTNAQRMGWSRRSASVEVPKREESGYRSYSADRDGSHPSA